MGMRNGMISVWRPEVADIPRIATKIYAPAEVVKFLFSIAGERAELLLFYESPKSRSPWAHLLDRHRGVSFLEPGG